MTSEDSPSSTAINTLVATGNLDLRNRFTEVHLDDGRILRLNTSQLAESLAIPELPVLPSSGQTLIPLIEEQLQVTKRVVPTGLVRLRKGVEEFDAKIDETLAVRTYDIERVVLNQPIETVPTIRTDGDTTVYPLVEERLVLTKQLILKEEVRVTRRDTERVDTQTVVLRREHLVVEREPLN